MIHWLRCLSIMDSSPSHGLSARLGWPPAWRLLSPVWVGLSLPPHFSRPPLLEGPLAALDMDLCLAVSVKTLQVKGILAKSCVQFDAWFFLAPFFSLVSPIHKNWTAFFVQEEATFLFSPPTNSIAAFPLQKGLAV